MFPKGVFLHELIYVCRTLTDDGYVRRVQLITPGGHSVDLPMHKARLLGLDVPNVRPVPMVLIESLISLCPIIM